MSPFVAFPDPGQRGADWADVLAGVDADRRHEVLWQWWCEGVILAHELREPGVILTAWESEPASGDHLRFELDEWQWWELFDVTGFVTDARREDVPRELVSLLDDDHADSAHADVVGHVDEVPFTVYRGCRTGWDGLAWTLDRQIADAARDDLIAGGTRAHTFALTVRPSDVLAYVHGRDRAEVIVSPDAIIDPRVVD